MLIGQTSAGYNMAYRLHYSSIILAEIAVKVNTNQSFFYCTRLTRTILSRMPIESLGSNFPRTSVDLSKILTGLIQLLKHSFIQESFVFFGSILF